MKKSIFLLLTFIYSAVFAGTWYQTITVVNQTDQTFSQLATINTGDFNDAYDGKLLLPYSTNIIKAKAPRAGQGDEINLIYNDKRDIVSVEMDDDVGYPGRKFECDDGLFRQLMCRITVIKDDSDDYQAVAYIQYF